MKDPGTVLIHIIVSVLIALLYYPLEASSQKLRTCYAPDGTEALGNVPCNADAENSTCCGEDWVCLSNKICKHSRHAWNVRGTCTDPSWDSPDCPGYCRAGHNDLDSCAAEGPGNFCCHIDDPTGCCETSSLILDLGIGTAITTIGAPPPATPETHTITMTVSYTDPDPSPSGGGSQTHTPSTTPATDSRDGSSTEDDGVVDVRIAAGVGVGVGVPVCVGVAALVFYFLRRRQKLESGSGVEHNWEMHRGNHQQHSGAVHELPDGAKARVLELPASAMLPEAPSSPR